LLSSLSDHMTYRDFINGVSFRFVQPTSRSWLFNKLDPYLFKTHISLEVLNTKFPEDKAQIEKAFWKLARVPRMSSFTIGALIAKAIQSMDKDTTFVNVGVWHGFSLLFGMHLNPDKQCVGIDNFSQFGGPKEAFLERFNRIKSPNHHFYDLDYKDYFLRHHSGKIGFYFYDGEHSYQNQLDGLKTAEPFFSEECIIFVDDTNWEEPRRGTLDFVKQSSSAYEILLDVRTAYAGHPTFWNGLMILQRRKSKNSQESKS
jgi:hypothetical protein